MDPRSVMESRQLLAREKREYLASQKRIQFEKRLIQKEELHRHQKTIHQKMNYQFDYFSRKI